MILHGIEKRRYNREQKAENRRKVEGERMASAAISCVHENDHNSYSNCSGTEDDPDPVHKSHVTEKPKVTKQPLNIVTSEVASSLDHTKVSNRNATFISASVAKALGHDPSQFAVNKESVRQSRRQHRETSAQKIKAAFDVEGPTGPLTEHWDGKILPALTGNDKTDRLAVIVSGSGAMKLLGVPQISSGTGEAQATAVFQLIDDWHLRDRIRFMCFGPPTATLALKLEHAPCYNISWRSHLLVQRANIIYMNSL
jgi:hypothetical protein